ncbi:MAG: aminoglycoside 6'-N-acetyltransferase [Eubacterium sp.]
MISIKSATRKEAQSIAEMAVKMWNDSTIDSLTEDFIEVIENDNSTVFIISNDKPFGFAQVGLRFDYVEGTNSSPVGYLEGIFIEEKYRHCGYAKQLLTACEQWAKEKGCLEFASDCELTNEASIHFHLSIGFSEANRIISFRKDL